MEDPNFRVALNLMLKSMGEGYEEHRPTNHQIVLTLGPTPPVLIKLGLPSRLMAITGKTIDKCFFDHGLTRSMLEKTYQIISGPKAIYKSKQVGCVVVSYEVKHNNPLILAVHPEKQLGGRKDFYNVVASMYYKENNPELRWKQEGLLLWEA